jgi:hypothetical protein
VVMSIRTRVIVAIIALSSPLIPAPIVAQHAPQANGDTRQVVVLTPSEAETMLTGMRTYLEPSRVWLPPWLKTIPCIVLTLLRSRVLGCSKA